MNWEKTFWNLKYKICKILLQVFLCLPDSFFSLAFKLVFPIYKYLHKKRAYGRVENYLLETKIPRTAKQVFESLFWNGIDSYRLLLGIESATSRVRFENEFIIQDVVQKEPVVAMSIHQGAFENMHRVLCRYSQNVHLVTNSFKSSILTQLLRDLRAHPHLHEYNIEDVSKVLRNLFKTKGVLAMVVDQSRANKGNKITLFGKETLLFLRLPIKANQMGAGIVTFRTYSNKVKKKNKFIREHVIRFENYYSPRQACSKEGEDNLILSIGKEVECWIKEHPEQWTWNYHKNFKV